MASAVSHFFFNLTTFTSNKTKTTTPLGSRRLGVTLVRCEANSVNGRVATVKNANDSLEICRVLNGMWQTSGGWGRIDRDSAVDAMLRYADAGLATFDMADHCKSKLSKS